MPGLSDIEIREVRREEEFLSIADIQKKVWGFEPADVAAPHLIMLHQRLGGVVVGAFDGDELVAFCYSFYGLMEGEEKKRIPIHWSHMLAVLPPYRGIGLGKALKQRQRMMILKRDVRICRWTFDPLETLNARLNIVTLGCVAKEYLFNVYGASTGHLHAGLTTDRFVAHWILDSERAEACAAGRPPRAPINLAKLKLAFETFDDPSTGVLLPGEPDLEREEEYIGVLMPPAIQKLKATCLDAAIRWREITADLFPRMFERGYVLVDVLSPKETERPEPIYVMQLKG